MYLAEVTDYVEGTITCPDPALDPAGARIHQKRTSSKHCPEGEIVFMRQGEDTFQPSLASWIANDDPDKWKQQSSNRHTTVSLL